MNYKYFIFIFHYVWPEDMCTVMHIHPNLSPGILLNLRHQLGLSSRLRGGCVICEGSPMPKETCNSLHKY